jgi:hypothetical protein
MLVVEAKPKRVRDDQSLTQASTGSLEPSAETAVTARADSGDAVRAGVRDDGAGLAAGGSLLGGLLGDYGSDESDDGDR